MKDWGFIYKSPNVFCSILKKILPSILLSGSIERYGVVKISELIQELLDIQHNAGEDVEVVGSILDYGKEPTNRRAGVIFPQLVHHRISLEQKCIISLNDCVSQNNPVEDVYYCFPDDIMGENWEVGYAEQDSMSWSQLLKYVEEENV